MELEQVAQPLSYEIAFFIQGLDNPDMPLHEKGDLTQSLIYKNQALAIIVLLVQGYSDGFYHNLIRSANLRKKFLSELDQDNISDAYHQCSGRIQGLIGAIVAKDFDLARKIIRLTPQEFKKTMEYEDDYCYAQLLHHLISPSLEQQSIDSLVDRNEVFSGEEQPRVLVVKAILARDDVKFNEEFTTLLAAHEEIIEEEKKRGKMEEADVRTHWEVYLEGLALLNLAEKNGINVNTEYLYCPSAARVAMRKPFPGL